MIVAEAYRDAQKVRGDGDAKASAIFAESFGKDPQFAQFYRGPTRTGRAFAAVRSDDPRPGQRVLQVDARVRSAGRRGCRRREEKVVPGSPSFWDLALGAVALLLIAEGLLPFVSPLSWRRIFERALQMSDGQIRFLGLVSVLCGLAMLLLAWA